MPTGGITKGYEMQNTLNNEIQEAIKKHLPEQTAGQLKAFFEEHQNMKGELKRLQEKEISAARSISVLKNEAANHRAIDDRELEARQKEAKLADVEAAIKEERRLLDVAHLNCALVAERKYSENVTVFMLNMSRNTGFKKTFVGDIPVGQHSREYDGNSGSSTEADPVVQRVTQTTTTEEE